MVEFPKVPTRFILTGDRQAGVKLVGFGKKRLSDLTTMLAPQNLPHGYNTFKLESGATIKTTISYGLSTIKIHVPFGAGGEKKEEKEDCQCYPCFAFAIVTEVVTDDAYPREYNLLVCAGREGRSTYVEYEDAHGIDWAVYPVGTYVFVSSKCLGTSCSAETTERCMTTLVSDPTYDGTDTEQLFIVPIHNISGMKRRREIV